MLLNCGNYFNDKSFKKLCNKLENKQTIEVYIDVIGHTRSNWEQETYKEELEKKYGDKLESTKTNGLFNYSYIYKLKD